MMHRTQSNPWLVGALGLAGTLLVLFVDNFGAGLTPDSAGYISAARSLASGNGLRWFNGELVTWWPPLYPAVLALASLLTGTDPLACAPVLNAVVFGLIIYAAGRMLSYHIRSSPNVVYAGTVAVLASIPVFTVCTMVWSEPLFLLFALYHLLSLGFYVDRPGRLSFTTLVLSTAAACLTRYIGVTLLLSGALSILLLCRADLKKRLVYMIAFGCASALPLLLWLVHNYVMVHTLTGPRILAKAHAAQVLGRALYHIDAWILPARLLAYTPSVPVLITLWGLVILAVGFVWYHATWRATRSIMPIALFTIVYFAFLITSATHVAFDPIDDRLLSPIYIPLFVITIATITEGAHLLEDHIPKRTLHTGLAAILCLWLLIPIMGIASHTQRQVASGRRGYSSNDWRQSETIRYVREHLSPYRCLIYSNDPYALYLHTGLQVHIAPEHRDLIDGRTRWPPLTPVCLVWFGQRSATHHLADPLQQIPGLSPAAIFSDGAIYLIAPRP